MRNTNEIFFGHLRTVDKNGAVQGKGGLTVAFKQTESGVEYAYARCHPNDNFVKKDGRIKAAGRLKSPRYATRMNLDTKDLTPFEVANLVINEALKDCNSL